MIAYFFDYLCEHFPMGLVAIFAVLTGVAYVVAAVIWKSYL
jgi:uncharacterized integral membrane protein